VKFIHRPKNKKGKTTSGFEILTAVKAKKNPAGKPAGQNIKKQYINKLLLSD
jgi:hypothetical protein